MYFIVGKTINQNKQIISYLITDGEGVREVTPQQVYLEYQRGTLPYLKGIDSNTGEVDFKNIDNSLIPTFYNGSGINNNVSVLKILEKNNNQIGVRILVASGKIMNVSLLDIIKLVSSKKIKLFNAKIVNNKVVMKYVGETITETSKSAETSKEDYKDFEYTLGNIVASGNCGRDGSSVIYQLDDKGLLVISGNGEMEDFYFALRIPWYEKRTSIKTVIIKEGVTRIGVGVFQDCTNLTSIVIPNSVTSLGEGAFHDTAWYNSQPNGVVYVGKVVYKYRGKMPANTHIVLKEGTKIIADGAFRRSMRLTSIIIPDSVISIGDNAFRECMSLTSVTIPNSVTSIGTAAFADCKSLTSAIIPNSVTSIGVGVFQDCTGLTSVTIPNSVTSIGSYAFSNCMSLISIIIPDSVISIECGAFQDCKSFTSVTIPNSVTSIGDSVFWGCVNLKSITIPDSVTSIGSHAFAYCTSLTSIIIPDSVTRIEENVFWGCVNLKSITIPDSVTSIGKVVFCDCRSLTSIIIPDSVTSIGSHAFWCCVNLKSITIPNSVIGIGGYAFSNCENLTSITIPNSVIDIGEGVFADCPNICIKGVHGSVAEKYAIDNNIKFVTLPNDMK